MSFFKNFTDVLKDIGTSSTRVITDTAIDLANVTTGFQFNDEMEKAKKKMSKAGIHSAAGAIERNHYSFLKEIEQETNEKYQTLTELYKQGENYANKSNNLSSHFFIMVDDFDLLSTAISEYEALTKQYSHYPAWDQVAESYDISIISLSKINQYHTRWQNVAQWVATSGLVADTTSALSGLSGIAAAAKAANLVKVSKIANAAQFTKFANIAGKASLVLTFVSVGLDIGLSVVQLEDRKSRFKSYLDEVSNEIKRANKDILALKQEINKTQDLIVQLTKAAGLEAPDDWNSWVVSQKQTILDARDSMISLQKAIQRAEQTIVTHPEYSDDRLVKIIQAADPQLTAELIQQIIKSEKINTRR